MVAEKSKRRMTIVLLLVAVAACFVPALDARPWLQFVARATVCAAFASALLVFTLGLPRRSGEDVHGASPPLRRVRGAP